MRARAAQEYMRAMQCFVYEWWDMDIKHMDHYLDETALEGLLGGWCAATCMSMNWETLRV